MIETTVVAIGLILAVLAIATIQPRQRRSRSWRIRLLSTANELARRGYRAEAAQARRLAWRRRRRPT